ncbi:MAG TPA: peptidoglycan editing factor PgeF [Salinivirga sp.]|uniref:peptidoglycan editing factor PgeF n=1 Tax=Salinivirga sp. TaxID=1970192 RepID=UPI002B48CB8D|nr:peptidoglycan editing factor PgeF [Salinivirga sp.]HKK59098.1 peptidoglycan editing factor PgeF [Salinivirga sp.]
MRKNTIHDISVYEFPGMATITLLTKKPFDMHKVNGEGNRNTIAACLDIPSEHLVFPDQNHTSNVGVVTSGNLDHSFSNTDALITNELNFALGVVTADCVPILLFDRAKKAIGAVHAGWRGTNARIVEKTIRAMQVNFGTKPHELSVGIGPSISPEVYEVGADVFDAFFKAGHNVDLFFKPYTNGKYLLNLWKANYMQLAYMGVADISIEQAKMCTFMLHDVFYSARREGIQTGRNAAIIKNQK